MEFTLETLMERYQQADSDAARLLIDQASPLLYHHLLRHTGTVSDAEDLLQETWLRVHRARHSYRPGRALLPWLLALADDTRIDACRHAGGARMNALPDLAARKTAAARARLPEGDRGMARRSKLSLTATAGLTGSMAGAVKGQARLAYLTLRKLLRISD